MTNVLKIATRKSPLALWQAHFVKQQLEMNHPDLTIELVGLVTAGDKNTNVALTHLGGKSLFVKELQRALLDKQADIAVHSIKDMSVQPCPGLTLAAVCQREDPRDVLASNHHYDLQSLPHNATVGTASPRRQSLLLALRSDLKIKLLRGNVGTRLAKLADGEYDAIVLALAGLLRLNMADKISAYLDPNYFIPAIGQAALGIECREDDANTLAFIEPLNHKPSAICISAERAVNQRLGGDCHTPLGAYATLNGDQLTVSAMVGSMDGQLIIRSTRTGEALRATQLGADIAEDLLTKGAQALLDAGP